jgi:hypothetical protein
MRGHYVRRGIDLVCRVGALVAVALIVWAAWLWFFVPWCAVVAVFPDFGPCPPPPTMSRLIPWALTMLGSTTIWVVAAYMMLLMGLGWRRAS